MVVNIVDISETFSGVVSSVRSLPRWFPLFSFFYLLVSSVSDFCPDTRGVVVDTVFFVCLFCFVLGSLVQSCCGEGGMLQTNNSGVCSQCLSHAGHAPAHGAHRSGSMSLRQELSEAGPRLHAPPQSKPYRLGSQVALRGADSVGPVLCPPQDRVAQVFGEHGRCNLSPFPAAQFSGCTAGAPCQADGDC